MQVTSASPDWGVVISKAQHDLVSYMNTNFTFRSEQALLYNNSFSPPPPLPVGGGGRGGQTAGPVPTSPPEGAGGEYGYRSYFLISCLISASLSSSPLSLSLPKMVPAHLPSPLKPSLELQSDASSEARLRSRPLQPLLSIIAAEQLPRTMKR